MKFAKQPYKKSWLGLGVFILCLLGAPSAKSQVLISLIFGDKLNTESNYFGIHLNESVTGISNFQNTQSLATFNLGLYFSHRWNEKWMLNVEALPKYRKGAKNLTPYSLGSSELDESFSEAEVSRVINYMGLPVTIRYFIKSAWFLEAGPQLNMRLKAQDIFTVDFESDEATYKNDIRNQVSKWDFDVVMGTGLFLGKTQDKAIGIRYHQGISDVLPDLDNKQSYGQWSLFLNLPIGRGKLKE